VTVTRAQENDMNSTGFLDDLQQRVTALLQQTPAADLQKNLKALLTQQFARLDLVTREQFDVQSELLANAQAQLAALERRVVELEARKE
jgi:BMFP domain-containing protein YqiC